MTGFTVALSDHAWRPSAGMYFIVVNGVSDVTIVDGRTQRNINSKSPVKELIWMTNNLPPNKRLAVLIDADNTSAKIADGLFEEIAKLGEATVRRLYGDFSSDRMKGWSSVLSKHAITEHQQRSYTSGKNASDIALVIDAMDLLHSGRFEGFCLVSSDSDFTRLASRLREEGVDVYGFGEQKTPESFRQACKRFIYTENLTLASSEKSKRKSRGKTPKAAIDLISKALAQLDQEDGWVMLATVGTQISQLAPDFDPRTYGFSKLSDLVKNTNTFELDKSEGRQMRIRLKALS